MIGKGFEKDLGAGDDAVCVHDPVRVFLPNLRDQQGSHPWDGQTAL